MADSDKPKKRKRETTETTSFVTFVARSRNVVFDRVFDFASYDDLRAAISKKLKLPPRTEFNLASARDGDEVVLEDEQDFKAFQLSTRRYHHSRVVIKFEGDSALPPTNAATPADQPPANVPADADAEFTREAKRRKHSTSDDVLEAVAPQIPVENQAGPSTEHPVIVNGAAKKPKKRKEPTQKEVPVPTPVAPAADPSAGSTAHGINSSDPSPDGEVPAEVDAAVVPPTVEAPVPPTRAKKPREKKKPVPVDPLEVLSESSPDAQPEPSPTTRQGDGPKPAKRKKAANNATPAASELPDVQPPPTDEPVIAPPPAPPHHGRLRPEVVIESKLVRKKPKRPMTEAEVSEPKQDAVATTNLEASKISTKASSSAAPITLTNGLADSEPTTETSVAGPSRGRAAARKPRSSAPKRSKSVARGPDSQYTACFVCESKPFHHYTQCPMIANVRNDPKDAASRKALEKRVDAMLNMDYTSGTVLDPAWDDEIKSTAKILELFVKKPEVKDWAPTEEELRAEAAAKPKRASREKAKNPATSTTDGPQKPSKRASKVAQVPQLTSEPSSKQRPDKTAPSADLANERVANEVAVSDARTALPMSRLPTKTSIISSTFGTASRSDRSDPSNAIDELANDTSSRDPSPSPDSGRSAVLQSNDLRSIEQPIRPMQQHSNPLNDPIESSSDEEEPPRPDPQVPTIQSNRSALASSSKYLIPPIDSDDDISSDDEPPTGNLSTVPIVLATSAPPKPVPSGNAEIDHQDESLEAATYTGHGSDSNSSSSHHSSIFSRRQVENAAKKTNGSTPKPPVEPVPRMEISEPAQSVFSGMNSFWKRIATPAQVKESSSQVALARNGTEQAPQTRQSDSSLRKAKSEVLSSQTPKRGKTPSFPTLREMAGAGFGKRMAPAPLFLSSSQTKKRAPPTETDESGDDDDDDESSEEDETVPKERRAGANAPKRRRKGLSAF